MEGLLTILAIFAIGVTVISALRGDKGSQRSLKIIGIWFLTLIGVCALLFIHITILSSAKDNAIVIVFIGVEAALIFPLLIMGIIELIAGLSYNAYCMKNKIIIPSSEYYFKTRTYYIENPERFLHAEMYQNLIQQKIIKSVRLLENGSSVLLRSRYGKYEISLGEGNNILLSAEISLWREGSNGWSKSLSPTVRGFHLTFSILECFIQFIDYTPYFEKFRKNYRRDTIKYGLIKLIGVLMLISTLMAVGVGTSQVYSEINSAENENKKLDFVKNLEVEKLGYENCRGITVNDVLETHFLLSNWEYFIGENAEKAVEVVEVTSIFFEEGKEKSVRIQFVLPEENRCQLGYLELDGTQYDSVESFRGLIESYKEQLILAD